MPITNVTKSWYQYVSADGTTFRMLLADYIATQNDVAANSIIGAVAAAHSLPRWKGGSKTARRALFISAAGKTREVVVCTPTAPVVTVPLPAGAGTLNLNETKTNVNVAYTYSGHFLNEYIGPAKP